jgi:small conductance mechanosensitive channel
MEDQVKSTFEIMSETVWGWLHAFVANVPNIIVAVLVFLLTILLSRLIRRSIKRWMSRTRASLSVTNLVSNLGAIVIIIGGLYLGLTAMNLEGVAQGILATASISGLIVGLALQNTFANTFAGIILSLIDDVQIGDWIESKGLSGEVQRISLRNTTVKGPDGNFIFIPNKDILDNPLRNLAKTSRSRIILSCGVAYNSDLMFVRETTINSIKSEFAGLNDDEIDFYFTEFGDSAIQYTTRFWIDAQTAIEEAQAKSKAIVAIKRAYDKVGINIPFPIRTLYFGEAARVLSKPWEG